MAKLGITFDANDVPERTEYTPLPPGQYTGMIVASELKPTKKGGEMIELEIDIQDGEYSGRKLFERLNIKNDNQKAVDIAFRTLGEICKAVGKTSIKDSDELHNKRFVLTVGVEPAKPYTKDGVEHAGSPQNSIKKYSAYSAGVPGAAPATSPSSSGGVESKPSSTPPWKRKA
jgi:hypothetical protein